jgi:hypothetical protein
MEKETRALWPREHGAYAQLGVALLCGVVLGHGSRGIFQALLAVALFLASEPVLVLLGRRGEAARGASWVRAALRLVLLGSLILLAIFGAWAGAPAAQLLGIVPAAALGTALFGLFLVRRERTAAGELVAAWAFSATAGSVVLLGGGGPRRATLLALLLGGMFTLATAIVHCHLLALKRGGTWLPRFGAFALGAVLAFGTAFAALRGALPRCGGVSLLPMTLAALWVWAHPPPPRMLKQVGWAATACALLGGGLAVFGLW